jgi:peptidyl-prolyl cis-trans isomerase D
MDALLTPQTWERLMLLQEAKRSRLQVSDRDLAEFIHQLPPFRENGRFVPDRYHRYLAALGTNPQAFEELLRHDLLIERLLNSRKGQVQVTEEEILRVYQQAHERMRASLFRRDLEPLREVVRQSVTDEDIRAYYDAYPEAVQVPAQVTFDYVGLSTEELRQTLPVTEEEIADYHASHPEEFQGEDDAPKPLEEVREAVREQLLSQRISRRLVELAIECEEALSANASLEAIAERTQVAIRTAGPLPVGSLGGTDGPESSVLNEAFSLQEGQTSRVVETDHGVYVVRVSRREPMRIPPLEEVRPTVVERLVAQKARDAAKAGANSLRTQLQSKLADGVGFEEAASVLGVTPLSPNPFTRTDPIEGLGTVPLVNAAVFAAAPGQPTDVLDTPSAFVFLVPHERLAADAAGLTEEERARLKDQLVNDAHQARLAEWLKDVRARANLKDYTTEATETTQKHRGGV